MWTTGIVVLFYIHVYPFVIQHCSFHLIGPFRYVDTVGAGHIVKRLDEFAAIYGEVLEPCQLLRDMAKDPSRKFHTKWDVFWMTTMMNNFMQPQCKSHTSCTKILKWIFVTVCWTLLEAYAVHHPWNVSLFTTLECNDSCTFIFLFWMKIFLSGTFQCIY